MAWLSLLAAVALQSAPPATECELHVWPSTAMTNVRQRAMESMGSAGAIDGIIKRTQIAQAEKHDAAVAEALAAQPIEPMSTARQIAILEGLALPDMLGLTGYRLVVHETPLESRTIRTVKTRYVESAAPCYADLIIDDVVYSREYSRGQNLKTFFRFRDFGTEGAAVRSFGSWVETKLQLFSIDPPNLGPAAMDELDAALRSNATVFSNLLAKRQTAASK
jgi:hypothetical protein